MTDREARTLEPGTYRLHWKAGGSSLASVGLLRNGRRWYAAASGPPAAPSSTRRGGDRRTISRSASSDWEAVGRVEPAPTPADAPTWMASRRRSGRKPPQRAVRKPRR